MNKHLTDHELAAHSGGAHGGPHSETQPMLEPTVYHREPAMPSDPAHLGGYIEALAAYHLQNAHIPGQVRIQ